MRSLFSIIMPIFNLANELPLAVDSVRRQTCGDWELVLVDDGSSDGSSALCDNFAKEDLRISVVHQSNKGVVCAREKGFGASSGGWILFLDGDDALNSYCLENLKQQINDNPQCDFFQFGYSWKPLIGDKIENLPKAEGVKSANWILAHSQKTPLEILGMCIWNKCYRRDMVMAAFGDVRDLHIAQSEDGLFAMAAFLKSSFVGFVQKSLYCYIERPDSTLHRVNTNIVHEKGLFLDRMRTLAEKSGKMTKSQIEDMIDFHAYEACCHDVFLMLMRNRATWGQMKKVLEELNNCSFLKKDNKEWDSFKRKAMRFLLAHHVLYFCCGKLSLFK